MTLNSVKELKSRYFKILRLVSKRLIKMASEHAGKVPVMVPFDD